MKSRLASVLWGLMVLVSAGFIALRLSRGPVVDTSLLSLLPASEGDPLLTQANTLLSGRAGHLLAFLVGHADPSQAADMGRRLKEELQHSGFVQNSLTDIMPEQQKAFYDLYFPFRYQMLSFRDRNRLQDKNPLAYFISRLAAGLYSPASAFLKNLIPQDPFLFFPELVRSWAETALPMASPERGEGIAFVDKDNTSYAFVAVELALDPFDSKNQERMMPWLAQLRARFQSQWRDSHFYMSGVLPFASAERLRTEREMTWVSLGSLAGVLGLTAAVFASLEALLLAFFPIAVGFVVAVAATLLCFGKIHIITFAFGSSLIGVAIDYPLLYLAYHRLAGNAWNPQETLRRVYPGLLLGELTTLFGYASLSLAPFPGLRQMALFSSIGLSAALLTVLLWLPKILTRGSSLVGEPRLLSAGQAVLSAMHRGWSHASRKRLGLGLLSILIFTVGGLLKLHVDDDIRRLQQPSAALAKEDAFIQAAAKGYGGNRFILVRGDTLEELLIRQEILQERLRSLIPTGTLSSIQSLAPFLPSEQQQRRDRLELQRSFSSNAGRLRQGMDKLGLAPKVANDLLQELGRPLSLFSIDQWLKSPASQMLRSLWIGPTAHGVAAAVLVGGLENSSALREALKDLQGVRFFDQIEEYSILFGRYRHRSVGLIVVAYIAVWALVIVSYGVKRGTLVTLPSVGAVLMTFALFGWCAVSVHLIHGLSALLVLSMGIDYSIYFAECARVQGPVAPTLLAVELCAASALLSFGFLAFCRTPVLSSIGMTVSVGMSIACLLSPLPYIVGQQAPSENA